MKAYIGRVWEELAFFNIEGLQGSLTLLHTETMFDIELVSLERVEYGTEPPLFKNITSSVIRDKINMMIPPNKRYECTLKVTGPASLANALRRLVRSECTVKYLHVVSFECDDPHIRVKKFAERIKLIPIPQTIEGKIDVTFKNALPTITYLYSNVLGHDICPTIRLAEMFAGTTIKFSCVVESTRRHAASTIGVCKRYETENITVDYIQDGKVRQGWMRRKDVQTQKKHVIIIDGNSDQSILEDYPHHVVQEVNDIRMALINPLAVEEKERMVTFRTEGHIPPREFWRMVIQELIDAISKFENGLASAEFGGVHITKKGDECIVIVEGSTVTVGELLCDVIRETDVSIFINCSEIDSRIEGFKLHIKHSTPEVLLADAAKSMKAIVEGFMTTFVKSVAESV